MNTRLMSGDAEDVIFTQELTMRRYTEMGAFEDLSPYLAASPEIGPDTHHMTPLELMRGGGGQIFELPLSWNTGEIVSFDAALVREAGIAPPEGDSIRYRDALTYAQKLVDGSALPNTYLDLGGGWELASRLLYDDFPSFLDYDRKTADFGGQRFIALLEEGKRLADQGYFLEVGAGFDFYNTEYHLALGVGGGGVGEAYWALAPEDTDHRSVGHRPLADAQGRVAMTASDLAGINSQSGQKALAWEFLKVLLSERAQTLPSFRGLGVHRAGFDAAVRRETEYLNGLNGLNTDPDAVAELLGGWMAQINHYARPENAVEGGRDSFLTQALDNYFHQGLDAETTARQLQAQVDKYLNE
jgi:multiple sugar transport system substrate-binding protein